MVSNIIQYFSKTVRGLAKLSILAIMTLTFISSIGRYVFNSPLPNIPNIIELVFLPAVIWLYAAEVQRIDDHISIDLLRDRLDDGSIRRFNIVIYPLVGLVFFIASLDLWKTTFELWRDNIWTSGPVRIPTFISRGIIALGLMMLVGIIIIQIRRWVALELTH